MRHQMWIVVLAVVLGSTTTAGQEHGTITGRVVAAGAAGPLRGVRVLLADPAREIVSDADGRFVLTNVPAGERTVVFMHARYADVSEVVALAGGQTTELEVTLPLAPELAESLTVVGRLSDYVEASAGASRTTARLIDVPQAIAVLPARLIEDIGALDTKELYKHISSVTDSPYSSTVVRGFTQREVLINGVRGNPYGSLEGDVNNSGFSTSQFRLTNVDRVEVLKGPSSVLYGSSEPGGVINYVTKQPRATFDARATVGTGRFGQTLAEAEVTGPLPQYASVLYRGALYFEERDSFRFNADTQNLHAVGSVSWQANPRRSFVFDYEYIDQTNGGHRLRGVPVDQRGQFIADYRWTATEPTDFTDLEAHVAQVRWIEQSTGPRVETTFRYLVYDRHENYHEPRGLFAGGTMMHRDFRDQFRSNDDWTLASHVSWPLRLGGQRHDIAFGGDIVRQAHLVRFGTAAQQSAGGPVPPLSLGAPVYRQTPAAYNIPAAAFVVDTAATVRFGVYAQNLMTLTRRWNAMVGARVDRYDDSGNSRGTPLAAERAALTARAGLVFKPRDSVSLYGSVANGFTRAPILAQTPGANGPHAPETSRQVELGAKTEWLNGRVQVTTAIFDTRKTNVLRPDPALGPFGNNANAVLATGAVANRGFELDVAGALTAAWHLAFNYSALHSEITRDTVAAFVGRALPNAAPHKVGVFSRLDLPWRGAVGGSLEYVGDREEPFAGLVAPAYTVVDAHYFQQIAARMRVLVRVENVFDARYSASSLFAARVGNIPGQPRTVSIALTVSTGRE